MDIKELFEKKYAMNAPSWSLERDPDGSYKYHATQSAFVLFEQQQIEIESLKVQLKKAQAVPESNALLSASLDAIQKLGSGDFVLVKKVKLIEIIGAIAIIEPITRGNPYMDFVKRELNVIGNIANTAIKAHEQSHEH